jgi:large subunit ribosomal protein L9
MKVVLYEEDVRLGDVGEVVKVANGYARNFLIPQGKAALATPANINAIQNQLSSKRKKIETESKKMQEVAKKIDGLAVEFKVQLSSGGQMFGTVTNEMIAKKIEEATEIKIDKKKIAQDTHIKDLGKYGAKVKIYSGVIAKVDVLVTEQEQKEEESDAVKSRLQRRRPVRKSK